MKNFIIFFISMNAFAYEPVGKHYDYASALEEIADGPSMMDDCPLSPPAPPPPQDSKSIFSLSKLYSEHGADCTKFITNKGELGAHGKIIYNHIDSVGNSLLTSNSIADITSVCPKWSKFSNERKKYFWVWFFAAIAWKESTCNEGLINKNATSGVAVGYMQLNEKQKDRKWRGGKSGKSCAATEVKTVANNLKCGLEIFNELLQGKSGLYEGNGKLGGKGTNSYWQDLRSSKPRILTMVKDFPGC